MENQLLDKGIILPSGEIGKDKIKELERAGDIVRSRERDEKGRLQGADYVIFEQPQSPTPDLPTLENPTQLNKDIQRIDLPEKTNTDLSSTNSIPIIFLSPSPYGEAAEQSAVNIPGNHQGQYQL